MSRTDHLPEYCCEAAALGLFMMSAGGFAILLAPYPRVLMGLAMGLTAVTLIKSPLGKRSGAHMNPAVTLTFYRLGKVAGRDTIGYVAAQFIGGAAGLFVLALLVRRRLESVRFVATTPGPRGAAIAFAAELAISFLLMSVVLHVSNSPRFARFTPYVAGLCVATFITFEAPLSGMSMNPARTFASAFVGGVWQSIVVYFVAPPLGMLATAMLYRGRVYCAKLDHFSNARCIFRCAFGELGR
jgi:aquaporin Z